MIPPNPTDDRYLKGWTDGKKEANELKAKQVEELREEFFSHFFNTIPVNENGFITQTRTELADKQRLIIDKIFGSST